MPFAFHTQGIPLPGTFCNSTVIDVLRAIRLVFAYDGVKIEGKCGKVN